MSIFFLPKHFDSSPIFDAIFYSSVKTPASGTATQVRNCDIIPDETTGERLTNGITFNHITRDLPAKKYIIVQIHLSFPKF